MPFSHDEIPQIGFRDAEVRILPPQPASQSLTHTESGRARNAAKWRHFAHKGGCKFRVSNWATVPLVLAPENPRCNLATVFKLFSSKCDLTLFLSNNRLKDPV